MLKKTTRAALLGSAAAFVFVGANAQDTQQVAGDVDPQACVMLAERLAEDVEIDAEIRADVEEVVAEGDVAQCHVIFTAWEEEGMITRESLELVATEQVTERMIVQQEVEVAADAAVYQPPPEIDVDAGAAEIVWTMPRQNVTVNEQAPQITVRQARPVVNVEVPQPRVTVEIPEPEVVISWPDSTLDMAALEPMIEVRIPEPTVNVAMPDPVVELTIGGAAPDQLVELEDGRFAPEGATEEDLQPRINVTQQEAVVSPGAEAEAPEIVFNRGEPVVTYEGEEPEVTVQVVGEPEIQVSTRARDGELDAQTDASATAEDTQQQQMQQQDTAAQQEQEQLQQQDTAAQQQPDQQQQPQQQMARTQAPEGFDAMGPEQLTADTLLGANVYDAQNQQIGSVEDLILAADGASIEAIVLDVGGFLGIGQHRVALQVQEVDIFWGEEQQEVRIQVPMTEQELEQLPEHQA